MDDNFLYEMYRYEDGKGVFRRYDYQWLDKDGNVVGEDSFSVTVSIDEGIIPSVDKSTQARKGLFWDAPAFSSLVLHPVVLRSSALDRPQNKLFRVFEF